LYHKACNFASAKADTQQLISLKMPTIISLIKTKQTRTGNNPKQFNSHKKARTEASPLALLKTLFDKVA